MSPPPRKRIVYAATAVAITTLLISVISLNNVASVKREKEAERQYQQEKAQRNALEKEANLSVHDWYVVKLGKFDGECHHIGRSARSDVDSYNSHASLERVKKSEDGEYLLTYLLDSPYHRKIYTTSPIWCQNIINANVEQ